MRVGRIVMGLVYVAAGVNHFRSTRMYESIMPDYLPAHHEMVLLSGVAEIAGGLGVLVPQTRRAAAWGLVGLLVAVMPANVWMVQHPERYPGIPVWALWVRLPLQGVLVWWAWRYTRADAFGLTSQ
jgi:uncharacterized membrane protein